jgi:hypothetical protein
MADTPGTDLIEEFPPGVQCICLHVVSPGPENRQTFPSIPVTTSIAQLKLLIADASPSHPAPGRQRLIYRGRRLAVDTDTLANVFGPLEVDATVLRRYQANGWLGKRFTTNLYDTSRTPSDTTTVNTRKY